MASETAIQNVSKDAELILSAINKGVVDLPRLKNFLVKVERLSAPPTRKHRKRELVKEYDTKIK